MGRIPGNQIDRHKGLRFGLIVIAATAMALSGCNIISSLLGLGPTASFTWTPLSPQVGDTVTLDGSGSSGNSITSYDWQITLPDSTIISRTGPAVQFTASLPGIYTAKLTVTNDAGSDSKTKSITVGGTAVSTVPQNVVGASGNGSATVTWDQVTGATSYNLYWALGPTVTKTGNRVAGVSSPKVVSGLANDSQYSFGVTSITASGESAMSAVVTVTPTVPTSAPAAITGVTASAGDGSVTVTWPLVSGASSYNLYYSTSSGLTKSNGNQILNVSSPKMVQGLANGTLYYFLVTAVNSIGESGDSNVVSATPQAASIVPVAPTGLTATALDSSVSLSWTASSGATSYNVYYLPGTTVTTGGNRIAGTTSPFTVSSLTNGSTYAFIVTAVNAKGESSASSIVTAIPVAQTAVPGQITGLVATAGDSQVALSWNANSAATSYNVYYASGSTVSTTSYTQKISVQQPSFTMTSLVNGHAYAFLVTGVNSLGEGAASTGETATPMATTTVPVAPTSVSATSANNQVTVAWGAVAGASSYTVYYAVGSTVTTASFNKIANISSTSYSQTVSGLTNGTPYAFIVTASNAAGEGAASSVATATPAPAGAAPTAMVTINSVTPGNSQVALSWYSVAGASYYQINYSTSASISTTSGTVLTSTGTSATIAGLTNGTIYYFIVTAANSYGLGPAGAAVSAAPIVTQTAPAAPSGVVTTSAIANITLSWGNVAGATGYNIYRSTSSGTEAYIGYVTATTAASQTYTDPAATATNTTGLYAGTWYYYTVTAYNTYGVSPMSNEVSSKLQDSGTITIGIQ